MENETKKELITVGSAITKEEIEMFKLHGLPFVLFSKIEKLIEHRSKKNMIAFADAYHKRALQVGQNCKSAEWFLDDFLKNGCITDVYGNPI